MFTKLFGTDATKKPPTPKEGDLFKIIQHHGKTFEIRYGFYEEWERHNPYAEPMEIYPDFIKQPQYTEDGKPFVTAIQNPCVNFTGIKDENTTCEECTFYEHFEELLGICICPANKMISDVKDVIQK